jgi:hypothetical protein
VSSCGGWASSSGSEYHPSPTAAEKATPARKRRHLARRKRAAHNWDNCHPLAELETNRPRPSTESLFGSSVSSLSEDEAPAPPAVVSSADTPFDIEAAFLQTASTEELHSTFLDLLSERTVLATVNEECTSRISNLEDRVLELLTQITDLNVQLTLFRVRANQGQSFKPALKAQNMDPNAPPANAPPAVPPAAQPAAAFALVPGDIQGVIDCSTRQGLAIHSQAVRSLYEDPVDLFNVESAGLQTFLALLSLRGTTCGWDLDVPEDLGDPLNNLLDFMTNHGKFTLEHIQNFSNSFIHGQSRAAQMNIQMVKCILASLTMPGFRKVQTWHEDWHIGGLPAAHALIKIIIRESFIDTQATTRILRAHLSSLPEKLEDLKGDIDKLNAFVEVTQDQLSARGETTHDLLANPFKGCLSSKDPTFCRHIEKKQEDCDDGTVFTVDSLMNLASNKFKTLMEAGKWMAPNDMQSKILALESKLGRMGRSSQGSSSNNSSRSNSGRSNRNNSNRGNSNQATSSGGNSSGNRRNQREIPSWMKKWPGQAFVAGNKVKHKDGKSYWWCKKHKRFCRHQTSECQLAAADASATSNTTAAPQSAATSSTPTIRVTAATLMDE